MKKRQKIYCPYCGAEAKLRPASVVYKENTIDESAYLFVCDRYPKCDAYVNAHKESRRPMGTLANSELRNRRILAHRAMSKIWTNGVMSKEQTYKWLRDKFGLSDSQAHIGMLSEYMCDRVIAACNEVCEKLHIVA